MVVDGENITGLERGRPAEPPPFPKPEIHYSKYAGNPFFSSGFRCHDRHKRLHDLKGAGIGRAPYDEGAVLPACRCHGQGVRHPTPQTACRTPNESRGARTIRRATTSRREAAILYGGRPPHKDRRCSCVSDQLMPTRRDRVRARIVARRCFRPTAFFPRNARFAGKILRQAHRRLPLPGLPARRLPEPRRHPSRLPRQEPRSRLPPRRRPR